MDLKYLNKYFEYYILIDDIIINGISNFDIADKFTLICKTPYGDFCPVELKSEVIKSDLRFFDCFKNETYHVNSVKNLYDENDEEFLKSSHELVVGILKSLAMHKIIVAGPKSEVSKFKLKYS